MELSSENAEIPMPISSVYVGGVHGDGHHGYHGFMTHHNHSYHPPSSPPHHHHTTTPPPPPRTYHQINTSSSNNLQHHDDDEKQQVKAMVRYRECQKNHAASMGGNVTDGCGEFMPSGEKGTLEYLTCSVCNCHRNFHRRDTLPTPLYIRGRKVILGKNTHQVVGPSDDQSDDQMNDVHQKKRVRTKFSQEQKEKMLQFAEKVEWKLQKQEEAVVQKFCQDVGVKRRVFKVWMHNNKHSLAKKNQNLNIQNQNQDQLIL